MRNFLQTLCCWIWRNHNKNLLPVAAAISVALFVALAVAAEYESVIYIKNGVGLSQNYGLILSFFLLPGALYLSILYTKVTCSSITGNFSRNNLTKKKSVDLINMVKLKNKERVWILYSFMLIGFIFISINIRNHVFGNPIEHWNSPVFDSIDHIYTFLVNRVLSIISFGIMIPYISYVIYCNITTLSIISNEISKDKSMDYVLFHPDKAGGFGYIIDSSFVFNFLVSIIYVYTSVYISTFKGVNETHIFSYIATTSALIFGNAIVYGKSLRIIDRKKENALVNLSDSMSDKKDTLQFEMFRYFTDNYSKQPRRQQAFAMLNFIKAVLPGLAPGIKLLVN